MDGSSSLVPGVSFHLFRDYTSIFPLFKGTDCAGSLVQISSLPGKSRSDFLLTIPIGVMELLVDMRPGGIGKRDFGGWSPVVYLVFFALGYVIAMDERFKRAMVKGKFAALMAGLFTTTIGYILLRSGYSSFAPLFSLLRSLISWCWLVAILGFGSTFLNFNNNFLKHANNAVLPFYVLHQTVIVIIGYLIMGWNGGVLVKYFALTTVSLVMIVGLYVIIIRRVSVFRFLFGMKA